MHNIGQKRQVVSNLLPSTSLFLTREASILSGLLYEYHTSSLSQALSRTDSMLSIFDLDLQFKPPCQGIIVLIPYSKVNLSTGSPSQTADRRT